MCNMKYFALLCALFGVVCFTNAKIPNYIKLCKRSDPDINDCIKTSIMGLKKHLAEGIPELEVPSLEPLNIGTISIKKAVQSNLTDIKVYGATDFEIIDIKAEPDKNRYAFTVKIPSLYVTANYEMDMKILVLNVKGNGPLVANLTDYQFSGLLRGKKMKADGQSHLNFEPMKINIIQGKTHMHLDNLFEGKDEELAKATNEVINDNPDTLLVDILPAFETEIAQEFTTIANIIASKFTYDELFPQ